MSTVLAVYEHEPKFPATDQQPGAQRYAVGNLWVDTLGGEPTQAEIDAVLHPPQVKQETVADLRATLIAKGVITALDVNADVKP
jgi:hypothetical protein